MKNIPLFTTKNGIASLTLEEIPFNKSAYVRVQSSSGKDGFIKECVEFCKAVGAENVYATGIDLTGSFASVLRMSRPRKGLQDGPGSLVSVDVNTLDQFRTIYNDAMRSIQNASGMTSSKASEMLAQGSGYFVYQKEELIGIGIAVGEWIRAIISLKRGSGKTIMLALNRVLDGERMRIEVIDSNLSAMQLYERMGFCIDQTVSKWYKIF